MQALQQEADRNDPRTANPLTEEDRKKALRRKEIQARIALLASMGVDAKRYRQDWLAAIAAVDKAQAEIVITRGNIRRYETEVGSAGGGQASALIAAEKARLATQEKTLAEVFAKVRSKYDLFAEQQAEFARVRTGAERELPQRVVLALREKPDREPAVSGCSLEGNALWSHDPNECRFAAEAAGARRHRSEGAISLPDRPVDRRGVTTQLITDGDKAAATIKLAGNSRIRAFPKESPADVADYWQRITSLSYSFGITADVAESKGRIFGEREDEDDPRTLDRLDERVKGVVSLGYNWFDKERGPRWKDRAEKMRKEAREACQADQATPETAFPAICNDNQLVAWIFAPDENKRYRNAKHVEAYNAVYWGPAEKVARAGVGATLEVARPRTSYFPFTTKSVPDELRPGKTKEVIDTDAIPASFFDDEPLSRRVWAYTVGAHAFYRFGKASATARALTLIPSITYKREFDKPAKVTICPAAEAGDPIVTTELCREAFVSDGDITKAWVPAIEARMHLPNRFILPWLVPSVGIAPKFSFERKKDDNTRYSFDMPFWFGMNSEGTLTGGLALQHQWGGLKSGQSRPSETSLSIFVSTTFDLGSK